MWPAVRLSRVARTISGSGFPPSQQGLVAGDLPFVKVSDVADAPPTGLTGAANWVSRATARELGAREIPPGSTLLPKVGAALLNNNRTFAHVPCVADNNVMAVVPTQGEPRYLYWVLRNVDMAELSGGGTLPFVTDSQVRALDLPYPPLEEQRRIADFLDEQVALLDRAVELRKRQISLIAVRARRSLADLYDFEAAGRRKARLHHLLRQSPSYGVLVPRFTELDGVPFVRVNDLAALQAGRAPATMISREQAYEYRRTIVEPGDVLTSVVGTLGVSAIVPDVARGANVARAVCLLRPAPGVTSWFLHGWLASSQFLASAERATGGGTAQATLNMGDLAKFEVAVPSAGGTGPVGKAVRVVLLETRSATDLLTRGLRLLEERKQALITAAVTGQLDVTTARSAA